MNTPEIMLMEGRVNVKWPSNSQIISCRRGCSGKMDLQATNATVGGLYQPEWLQKLNVKLDDGLGTASSAYFPVGGRVRIGVNAGQLKEKQFGRGGWTPSMEQVFTFYLHEIACSSLL